MILLQTSSGGNSGSGFLFLGAMLILGAVVVALVARHRRNR